MTVPLTEIYPIVKFINNECFLWALGFIFLSLVQALSGFMIIRSVIKYFRN